MFIRLGIKQTYDCMYICIYITLDQLSPVERAKGMLKDKTVEIWAVGEGRLTWADALPIALMT